MFYLINCCFGLGSPILIASIWPDLQGSAQFFLIVFGFVVAGVLSVTLLAAIFSVSCRHSKFYLLRFLRRFGSFSAINLLIFLFAYWIGNAHLSRVVELQLPPEFEGKDLSISVKIMGVPHLTTESTRFDAEVIAIVDQDKQVLLGKKLRLSWRQAMPLKPGDVWQLSLRLKRPRGFVNPGGFDYQAWLLHQGIYATGYVKASGKFNASKTPNQQGAFNVPRRLSQSDRWSVDAVRHYVASVLSSESIKYSELYKALLLGVKQGVSQEHWDVFHRTGTVHLMAISGLHIGLVAGLVFFIAKLIAPVFTFFCSPYLIRLFPAVMAIVSAASYALLAGMSIPTQRALIFVSVYSVAYAMNRNISPLLLLFVACVLVMYFDPLAVIQSGFWLSFIAVATLAYCFSHRISLSDTKNLSLPALGAKLKVFLLAQVCVFIGLYFPLTYLGLGSSALSPFANMLAIPFMSFLLLPVIFIGGVLALVDPLLSIGVLQFNDLPMALLLQYLSSLVIHAEPIVAELDAVDGSLFSASAGGINSKSELFKLPIALLAILLVLSPYGLRLKIPGILMCIVSFFVGLEEPEEGIRLTILDVGQGLSVVAQMADKSLSADQLIETSTIVYDVGARFSPSFDLGKLVVGPFLKSQNIRQVNALVISHGDNDHAGGLQGVLAGIDVERIVTNSHYYRSEEMASIHHEKRMCVSDYPPGTFAPYSTVLWPPSLPYLSKRRTRANNRSCVMLLEHSGLKVLLAGDIERDVELALIEQGRLPSGVDILIAGHHGSKTSSSQAFIDAVEPKHVVFSAGYKNRYGHPADSVVQRFRSSGVKVWNTAIQGAITVKKNGNGEMVIWSERERNPRVWY